MAQIPLKQRRMLARGFNRRSIKLLGGRYFRGIGNRATLTTAMAGTNNDLTLLAKTPGTGGNAITFRIVVAGASTPLSVSVAGSAITVNSATSAGSAATSTAREVRRAVNFDRSANPLVHAQDAPQNDGTGVVAALGVTNLAGAV